MAVIPRPQAPPRTAPDVAAERPIAGPVTAGWREGTLTRAKELEALCAWVLAGSPRPDADALARAVPVHLEAARQAATGVRPHPRTWLRLLRGPQLERAMSNLDAAEALILNLAPAEYVLGQLPCLLAHVQAHLVPTDPRRREFERIARRLGVEADPPAASDTDLADDGADRAHRADRNRVEQYRGRIVTTTRAASSAALREQVRVRSFRNVLVSTTLLMTLLAAGIALIGYVNPTLMPLCFAPEESGQAVVVCPTAQSAPFAVSLAPAPAASAAAAADGTPLPVQDIDDAVQRTATKWDLLVVELIGLTAAAVAAAAAIRGIRGSSERSGLPVALAALKLPTGALTAFLGLLLMRGQFVPGLSALDTSAQILAWALVFGYAQQLFTRLVDQQGHHVLDAVRGADRAEPAAGRP